MTRRAGPWLVIALLVIVFTALNLSLSARSGTLAIPPIYDDVFYLTDAYHRMAFGHVDTLAALVRSFVAEPPHAPMNAILAMLGFSLFGPHLWGPYAANACLLAAFGATVYLVARHRLEPVPSLLIVALMFFAPVAHAMVTEFRPDMGAGVIFALAVYLLVFTDCTTTSRRRLVLIGCVCALAVMAKPSSFIATIPMLGVSWLAGLALSDGTPRARIGGGMIVLAAGLVLLLPYAIIWAKPTLAYVHQALVSNSDIWSTPGDWKFHWAFHSSGRGGRIALGIFLPVGLVAIAADVLLSARRWREPECRRAAAYYAIVALTYCGLAMSAEKSHFQGSFFYVPLLVASTIALSRLAARVSRPVLLVAPLLAIGAVFLPPATLYTQSSSYAGSTQATAEIVDIVSRQIEINRGCGPAVPAFAAVAPFPVWPEAVALLLALSNNAEIAPRSLYFYRSGEELVANAKASDFVMLPSKYALEKTTRLPGTHFADLVDRELSADPGWLRHVLPGADPATLFYRVPCAK